MIPVNPGQAGKEILGQKVYADSPTSPSPVDMVDIFRASQYAPAVVEEALAMKPRPQVIWMQLGVRNDEAAAKAEAAGTQGRDEPLPEDRIRPPVLGDRLDRRQFPNLELEAGAAPGKGMQRMSLNRSSVPAAPRRPRTRAAQRRTACDAEAATDAQGQLGSKMPSQHCNVFFHVLLTLMMLAVRLSKSEPRARGLWQESP